ncbi:protein FAM171A1 isoform X2 [Maylandia zebra]|uniref:Family with sequence similarity 171 member A1 n=1 Tax=Maylandia zebra TaxID=106582 RepID=A0A3P9B352_9CICH|nr:protein FAM171A1 isoform X2 [Maylandia zebra]XP_026039420.1 protein FAM171A1 [Astatotilapia calliptera]
MRAVDRSRTAAILLCLFGYLFSKAATKTLQEDTATQDVTLKVHLSDASTHQPLVGATVQLFANRTSLTTETSSADGNIYLRFPYRLGTPLVVTATKQGYVPNSVPWTPSRLPVFSSISLDLLPERAATLMVYEDVVEIVPGLQGLRVQPRVSFLHRALSLPPNTSYANLTALLTVATSPSHIQHFPHLEMLSGNGTGTEKTFELTPVAAISVHLLAGDGVELQVTGPITFSVPLPPDSGLKENDHLPTWRFDPRLGIWIKSSWAQVQREGNQLSLTYIVPQLGYWVAAMSSLHTGPMVAKDISTYHTVFLLAILGGMALILLCLLCLLLYYCRRRCLKPRGSHRKLTLSSGLDSSKRDQATSMSHLNLISNEVQLELVSTGTEPDMTTPMLKPSSYEHRDNQRQHSLIHQNKHSRSSLGNNSHHGSSLGNLTPRSRDYRQSVETFQLRAALSSGTERGYRQSYTSFCSSSNQISDALSSTNHGQVSATQLSSVGIIDCISPSSPPHSPSRGEGGECRAADHLLSRSVDHLERPSPQLLSRPGQLLCCGSVDLLSGGEGYSRVRPTLVIPAHYMRLPGEHPLSGQALLLQTDQQSDLETIQAELNASHSQQPLGQTPTDCDPGPKKQGKGEGISGLSESLSIPGALGESGLVEINSEDTLLAEKTLMELRGGKPLPHPRAWFVSLDGRSNAHIRHSYIDLQRAGCHNNNNSTPSAGGQQGSSRQGRHGSCNDASLDSGVDLNEPRAGRRGRDAEQEERGIEKDRSKGATPASAYTQLVFVDDLNVGGCEEEKCTHKGSKSGPVLSDKGESNRVDQGQGDAVGKTAEGVQIQEEPPSLSSASPTSPPPLPTPEGVTFRTDHALLSVSPDEDAAHDDAEEEKKSPWQRREERPLLAFNLK